MTEFDRTDRDINKLRADVRLGWMMLRERCLSEGIDLLLTEGWRSPVRQDWLYASGRTRLGPILTHAKRGQSDHNWTEDGTPASKAIDICFITERNSNGKPVAVSWDGPWVRVAAIAKELGFSWGGDWPHPKADKPHFYMEP